MPAAQTPLLHLSEEVQASPSEQLVPSFLGFFPQAPEEGLQTPTLQASPEQLFDEAPLQMDLPPPLPPPNVKGS